MASDRISSVPATSGRTGNAARFEIRGGDLLSGSARAELAYWDQKATEGDELIYNWSTRFAADYPSSAAWQSVVQWKNDGTGSPPLHIGIWGDQLRLEAGPQHNWKTMWETPLVRGQWLNFTARIKFSSDPAVGWVELWYGGQLVLPRTPTQTLFPGLANYFKVGLYRDAAISGTGVVFHDGVRIARA
jgi:hypothetical protein